jgi:hypothetical protein
MTPSCQTCQDGLVPTRLVREGRASYSCADCRRDVSLVVFLIAEAFAITGEEPHFEVVPRP